MAHDDTIIFPNTLVYGGSTGPRSKTNVVHNAGGFRKTNRIWSQYLRRFNITHGPRRPEVAALILAIWETIGGPAGSFLGTDPNDWNTTEGSMGSLGLGAITKDDQPMQNTVDGTYVGDGSTTTFQLLKQRTEGTQTNDRIINKPRATPVPLVAIDATLKVTPGDYSINFATGIATFVVALGVGEVPTWGGAFWVPLAFVGDELDQQVISFDLSGFPALELIEVRLP